MGIVQAALAVLGALPPPAPGAPVLAVGDGARARRAADAREALVVERVVGDVVRADVVPHARLVPLGERVELQQAGVAVPLRRLHLLARDALAAAQAADPGVQPDLRAPQRLDLARLAALVTQELAVAEEVDAVVRDHLLDLGGVRAVHAHAEAVALVRPVDELVGLGVETPGVEREDRDGEAGVGDHVRERLVLDAEGGGEGDAARIAGRRVGEDLLGAQALESGQDVGYRLVNAHSVSPRGSAPAQKCNRLNAQITFVHDRRESRGAQAGDRRGRSSRVAGEARPATAGAGPPSGRQREVDARGERRTPSVSSRRSLRQRPPP